MHFVSNLAILTFLKVMNQHGPSWGAYELSYSMRARARVCIGLVQVGDKVQR